LDTKESVGSREFFGRGKNLEKGENSVKLEVTVTIDVGDDLITGKPGDSVDKGQWMAVMGGDEGDEITDAVVDSLDEAIVKIAE
jgi:hypothetical protein